MARLFDEHDTEGTGMVTVLLFSPEYPPDSGGAAIFYSNLLGQFPDTHTIVVVTSYHPSEPLISTDGNVTLYRIFPHFEALPVPLRVALETATLFFATIFIITLYHVDIVQAHGSAFSVLGIGTATLLVRTPVIYDCKDEGVRPWIVRVGPVQKWFSVSSNVDAVLIEGGISEDDIIRIPVVNPSYVSDYDAETDDGIDGFEIIYVGELRELKGVHILIEAFDRFARCRTDVHLTFVGGGEAREKLDYFRQVHNLEDKVRFTGRISHKNAIHRIATADVLVHPSASETGPRSVTEAFELGTPVIATPVGIVPDYVTHGESGLLINRSAESIFEALKTVYDDEDFRRSLASGAKEVYASRSWDAVSERVLSTYCDVLS